MVQVVWFKRDLRTVDHRPLLEASRAGPVIPLYVVEPGYWRLPDTSRRQWLAIRPALEELRDRLAGLGLPLVVRTGEAVAVLRELHERHALTRLLAHEETGNGWTFARDRAVRGFCRKAGIPVVEHRQFGVVRGPLDRDRWGALHAAFLRDPPWPEPLSLGGPDVDPGAIPTAEELGLPPDGCAAPQPGSRADALSRLDSFLAGRGAGYRRDMSTPLAGETSCSRLSVGLSTGAVSIREVLKRLFAARDRLSSLAWQDRPVPLGAVDSLVARLYWHCHFIQKLESEPAIETRSLHPVHEAARRPMLPDDPLLEAWATGRTGFPFVDACMRSLVATGWLNFRMRAMVTAFATYHLGLDWHAVGLRLARLFTDYEPGIHWPQVQMQAGQTGINTPRIYNPVKQGHDQDPDGIFTRRWVHELADVPQAFLHEPWRLPADPSDRPGAGYPAPVVDHEAAARAARDRLTRLRREPGYRAAAMDVYRRHGSRKRRPDADDPGKARAVAAGRARAAARQLRLDL
ncbi:FAD-binding domain-containing protein [Alsobacter sp. R-9]